MIYNLLYRGLNFKDLTCNVQENPRTKDNHDEKLVHCTSTR